MSLASLQKQSFVILQYQVVRKLRSEILVLRGEIDAMQRLQQENSLPATLTSQSSV